MTDLSIPQSRYECKYLVDAAMVPEIRRCLRPFMKPDAHALSSGGIYTISSLYLDAPDLRLLRMGQEGASERFKLRARTYSDHPSTPVWLEIKRRYSGVVHKIRTAVSRPSAQAILERRSQAAGTGAADIASMAFREAVLALDARPMAHVRYQREAYEARAGKAVRVTFDTDVEYQHEPHVRFEPSRDPWQPAGIDGVVLEIKFTDSYPRWIQALLARFELERRSISKYTRAMEAFAAGTGRFATGERKACRS